MAEYNGELMTLMLEDSGEKSPSKIIEFITSITDLGGNYEPRVYFGDFLDLTMNQTNKNKKIWQGDNLDGGMLGDRAIDQSSGFRMFAFMNNVEDTMISEGRVPKEFGGFIAGGDASINKTPRITPLDITWQKALK